MFRKASFTLIEILITMTIFSLVITMVLKFYVYLIWNKTQIEARQNLIENSYYMLEKIQSQMKNYTIDYEEYFNRMAVWCDNSPLSSDLTDFARIVWTNWYCDNFTSYGNWNHENPESNHILYHCSRWTIESNPKVIQDPSLQLWNGCFEQWNMEGKKQSFGQYKKQFIDVWYDVDTVLGSVWDDDDIDLWIWPISIWDNENIQELYLISKDNQKRTFFRRAFVNSWDFDNTWWADKDFEKLYTIQFLKLQSLDIWSDHNLTNDFAPENRIWLYDGDIDTRVCDPNQWFVCGWSDVWWVYSWNKIPNDQNDGRINLFQNSVTVSKRNLSIYPTKSPKIARSDDSAQINPYSTISIQTKLYWEDWMKKLPSIDIYTFSLQTTFSTNSFY